MLGHRDEGARPGPRFTRKADRVDVNAQVYLRRSGKLNYRVRAYDATRYGCRLEFVERPRLDERVWIKFEGISSVEGFVCWVDGFIAGIEFAKAIHPAVFESLVRRLR